MELLFVVLVLVLLATPVAALVAFLRTSGLRKEVERLQRELGTVRRALSRVQAQLREEDEDAQPPPRQWRRTRQPTRSRTTDKAEAPPEPSTREPLAEAVVEGEYDRGREDDDAPRKADAPDREPPGEEPEEAPGGTQEAPSGTEEAPGGPQEVPGGPQEVPGGTEEAPGGPQEVPGGTEEAPGGTEEAPGGTEEAESASAGLDFETRFGTTWLLRIALGILAIALALFARNVAPQLSPAAKVAAAYAGSLLLFGLGKFFEDRLERFARPVMAGGLAFGFFVAYAAHFVPAMQAVSMPVSIGWMAISMATVLVAAERWRSQATAGLAIFLGHVSAYVSAGQADLYSLVMIGFLSLTAALLLLRHRWIPLGVVAMVAAYGSHLLWILAERAPISGDVGFWTNLGFLTSYYIVFLVADIMAWRRRADAGDPDEAPGPLGSKVDDRGQRQLGPINLVLYVALTTFVYFVSEARVETIEVYFFTLGALQASLAWWYYRTHHRDFVYYPVFGSVLWTLGLFAWMDALALNLVLATQALLLLMAAHRTRLWVFHALAQVMLVIAFVHYWSYPLPDPTWGVFAGGMGLVLVYLAKSTLEEIWYTPDALAARTEQADADEAAEADRWSWATGSRAFWNVFREVAPVLPYFHAALAAFVLVRENRTFFGDSMALAVSLTVAQLVVLAATHVLRSRALPFVLTSLAAIALVATGEWSRDEPAGWFMASLAGSALLLAAVGRLRPSDRHAGPAGVHAQAIVALVIPSFLVAAVAIGMGEASVLPWLLVPVLLYAAQEALAPLFTTWVEGNGSPGSRSARAVPTMVPVGISLAAVVAIAAWLGRVPSAPVTSSIAALVLAGLAARRKSLSLFVGGYALLLLGDLFFLVAEDFLARDTMSSLWAAPIVTLAPFLFGVGLDRSVYTVPDPEGARAGALDALVYVPYGVAYLLLFALGHFQLPLGWSLAAPAGLTVGLLWASATWRTPRLAEVLALGLAFLGLAAASLMLEDSAAPGALWGVVVMGALCAAGERLAVTRLRWEETTRERFGFVIVGAATLAMMAAIYESALLGSAWATAGWSVMGVLLMGSGFAFGAASHRRIGLLALGVCIVRVFVVDTQGLSDTAQIGAFFVLGLCLLGVALLYARYARQLRKWL